MIATLNEREQVFIELILICSCRTNAVLFCIYCNFEATPLYKPDGFLRKGRKGKDSAEIFPSNEY